ncbi:BlaR1 peptidase M56 family membrane protein [Stigmatella aurantiaca DW4/3-1]|uniref:BlaR1 peptidase M56 family membrane protein n=1 Tax=Stigmatella aurantiaca (strain DW4/3-1) TaxID=378806 RepID=Q096E7_STIAD|nr:BlaR1 peptidase M56 family membrane protein [Stigmatella aurantiaca DW4/3-1]
MRALPRLPASVRAGLWWAVALKFVLTLGWPRPLPLPLLAARSEPAALAQAPRSPSPSVAVHAAGSSGGEMEEVMSPPLAPAPVGGVAREAAWPPLAGLVLFGVWAMGVAWQLRGHVRSWRQVRGMRERARPLQHPELEEELDFLSTEAGLRRPPRLLVSSEVASPLAAGLLSPVVVLPAKAVSGLPVEALRMALAHEVAHLRRGDLWMGWAPAFAETVLFFHPLVRQAAREYALAREEACDAEALRLTGAEPADYGELLITFGIARAPGTAAALGASVHLHALHRRLRMLEFVDVMSPRPRRLLTGALCALGVVALVPFQVVAQEPPPAPPAKAAVTPAAPPAPPAKAAVTPAAPPAPPAKAAVAPAAPPAPSAPAAKRAVPVPPVPPVPPMGPLALKAPPVPPVPPVPPMVGDDEGDSFVLVTDGSIMMSGTTGDLHLARTFKQGGKDLLYVRRGEKAFIIRDTKTLQQLRALMQGAQAEGSQQHELGKKQGELGRKQGELGVKQGELGMKQGQLGVKHAEVAQKRAALALEHSRRVSLQDEAEQERLEAELEKKEQQLEREEEAIDQEQEALSEQQEALGRQQEALGDEQESLSREQEKLARQHEKQAREVQTKVRTLIDEALKQGLGEPLPS